MPLFLLTLKHKATTATDITIRFPTESVQQHVSEHRDQRQDNMASMRASASAYFVEQGYTATPPAEVRQSYISSVMMAQSTRASDIRNSVSAYMATQTNESFGCSGVFYKATATGKPSWKDRFKMKKRVKGQ